MNFTFLYLTIRPNPLGVCYVDRKSAPVSYSRFPLEILSIA